MSEQPRDDGADELFRRHEVELAGSAQETAMALIRLADLFVRERRDLEEAADRYDEALGLVAGAPEGPASYHAHVGRARVARLLGDPGRQAHHLDEAVRVCRELDERQAVPDLLLLRSGLDVDAGDLSTARARLVEALAQAEANADEHQAARVHFELGRLERRSDASQLARAHFELARPSLLERGPKRLAASVELELGLLAFTANDFEVAEARLQSARALWLELGSAALAARTLSRLGEIARVAGRRGEASALLDQALMEARACGDATLEAHTQCARGDLARLTSRYPEAEAAFGAAFDLGAQEGLSEVQVRACTGLASVKRVAGATVAARRLLDDAAAMSTITGDRRGGVNARVGLATLARLRGDGDASRRLLDGAQALAGAADYDLGLSNVAHGMAMCALIEGDGQEADNQLRLADVFSRDLGARHNAVHVLVARSLLALLVGDLDTAGEEVAAADTVASEVGYRLVIGQVARIRAAVVLADPARPATDAAGHLQRAADIAVQIGDVLGLADARATRAELALRLGEPEAAAALLDEAEPVHRRAEAIGDLAGVLTLRAMTDAALGDSRRANRRWREARQVIGARPLRPRRLDVATSMLTAGRRVLSAADLRAAHGEAASCLTFLEAHLPDGADPQRFRAHHAATFSLLHEGAE